MKGEFFLLLLWLLNLMGSQQWKASCVDYAATVVGDILLSLQPEIVGSLLQTHGVAPGNICKAFRFWDVCGTAIFPWELSISEKHMQALSSSIPLPLGYVHYWEYWPWKQWVSGNYTFHKMELKNKKIIPKWVDEFSEFRVMNYYFEMLLLIASCIFS